MISDSRSASSAGIQSPLAGVRILDLTQYLAGPVANHLLSQLGAEIVKVEPPTGDPSRRGKGLDLESEPNPVFLGLHRNKRSVAVDLATEAGRSVVHDLCRHSEVLIENYRPGVAAKLGVLYEDVRGFNPGLIYCSISGFGGDGPMAGAAATDGPIQAFAGVMYLHGEPGRPAPPSPINMADVAGGLFAAHGVLAALYRRERTGEGCRIDVSLFESLLQLVPRQVHELLEHGALDSRAPLQMQAGMPTLQASDGRYVMVQLPYPHHQETFRRLIAGEGGVPELLSDERFASQESRIRHAEAYVPLLRRGFEAQPSARWMDLLRQAQIPAGLVSTLGEALENPQLAHRESLIDVEVPILGKVRALGAPFKFEPALPPDPGLRPPVVGEHTEAVLSEVLGYAPERIASLVSSGAVATGVSRGA